MAWVWHLRRSKDTVPGVFPLLPSFAVADRDVGVSGSVCTANSDPLHLTQLIEVSNNFQFCSGEDKDRQALTGVSPLKGAFGVGLVLPSRAHTHKSCHGVKPRRGSRIHDEQWMV